MTTCGVVGLDHGDAAVGRAPLHDHQPAPIVESHLDDAAGFAAAFEPGRDRVLWVEVGIGPGTVFDTAPDDVREPVTKFDAVARGWVEIHVVFVAQDKAVVGIEKREAFGNAVQRLQQSRMRPGGLGLAFL